jgi:BioD-like phosphotransacetylase family protein
LNTLLLAGLNAPAGKTALAAGITAVVQSQGRSVSYVKSGSTGHEDVAFLAAGLGIAARSVTPPPAADVAVVEWPGDLADGARLAEELGATAAVVVRYRQGLTAATVLDALASLALKPAVVFNAVPEAVRPAFERRVVAPVAAAGLTVLGVVPETPSLLGFSVGELATALDAEFLVLPDRGEGLIESLLLGANAPDPAVSYFQPHPHSALFCRSDRPDIQLAALDSPVRCLVFCGAGYRQTSVLYRAEDLGVPVLQVATGVLETIARLTPLAEGVRFRQGAKIPIARDLVAAHLDLAALLAVPAGA